MEDKLDKAIKIHAMKLLLAKNHNVAKFLFNANQDDLADTADNLLSNCNFLSRGEHTLLRIAVEIWIDDEAYTCLYDILHNLDPGRFYCFLQAILFLKYRTLNIENIISHIKNPYI
jgi:hypothetical protein